MRLRFPAKKENTPSLLPSSSPPLKYSCRRRGLRVDDIRDNLVFVGLSITVAVFLRTKFVKIFMYEMSKRLRTFNCSWDALPIRHYAIPGTVKSAPPNIDHGRILTNSYLQRAINSASMLKQWVCRGIKGRPGG